MKEEFRMEYIKMVPVPSGNICRVTLEFDKAYERDFLQMFGGTHGDGRVVAVRPDETESAADQK